MKHNTHPARFFVWYKITASSEAQARAMANEITVEQTIEFPPEVTPTSILDSGILGRIENFFPTDASAQSYQVCLSYAAETTAFEFTQFLNVIFGNISLKPNIRLEKIEFPRPIHPQLANLFEATHAWGVDRCRTFWQLPANRPLLCSALKPMGLTSDELANLAHQFALGGVDLIKDDHGLSDQPFSRYQERIEKCCRAFNRVGAGTVYAPNITAPSAEIKPRAIFAKACGAKALMVAPAIVGFETLRSLANDPHIDLPILAHPAMLGSYSVYETAGISHMALYGQLMRLAGAAGTIYPNFGGRFSFTREQCRAICDGCRTPLLERPKIFACPGGGMHFENVPEMVNFYGPDVIFLMGGGLFQRGPSLVENCKELQRLIQDQELLWQK